MGIIDFLLKNIQKETVEEQLPLEQIPEDVFYTRNYYKDRKFIIGDYTYGKPDVIFENENANLVIGKFCSIAEKVCIFLGGNHRTEWITTYPFSSIPKEEFESFRHITGHPTTKGDVVIGNDVWIGRGVTILSGVKIGDGAVISAESVVTKEVGSYEIWGGNPAKFIRKRFSAEEIAKLQEIQWWNWDIEKIKENIPLLMSENIDKL